MTVRTCGWCKKPIDPSKRRDAATCSQSCRQAAHRFTRDSSRRSLHDASIPMRFAYADPPYPGMSKRYYADHPDFAGEVDHRALIERLSSPGRYDGWALSTSAASLPFVLSLCAGETRRIRVAAWVRGARPHTSPRGPLASWEPVVFAGGRDGSTRLDSLTHISRPRLTDPDRVVGAKPAVFARWLFELLGATAGDELVDLFPGSGGITKAWSIYTSHPDPHDLSLVDEVTHPSHVAASDTSHLDPHDVSPLHGGHASCRDLHDTSHLDPHATRRASTSRDASHRAAAQTSLQDLRHASLVDHGHASHSNIERAS